MVAVLLLVAVLVPAAIGATSPDPLPQVAFVARNDVPFDAMTVGPVAGALGGVVVITSRDFLSGPARTALEDFGPDKIYIAGGPSAISASTAAQIQAAGTWTVERIQGANRDETAQRIAELPGALGFARPVLTADEQVFGAWSNDYEFRGHDHGVNPGAAGDDFRDGGVATGSANGVGAGTTSVLELTVTDELVGDECPVGFTDHNFLVTASGTARGASGTPTAEQGLTLDSTTFPMSGEEATTIRRQGPLASGSSQSFSTQWLTVITEGSTSDRTFRLLARAPGGTADITAATMTVLHLGWTCEI